MTCFGKAAIQSFLDKSEYGFNDSIGAVANSSRSSSLSVNSISFRMLSCNTDELFLGSYVNSKGIRFIQID